MERQQRVASADASVVIVIGNTTTTIAVFSGVAEAVLERIPTSMFADPAVMTPQLDDLLRRSAPVCAVAICSVVPDVAAACANTLALLVSVPVVHIGPGLDLPFNLEYENRSTFGADRVALCAWSCQLFPDEAHIAVDIGTAITFDVLDSSGDYAGGLIMPGVDMMSGALHARTAQLPLVSVDRGAGLLGHSTGECIRSGIFWGVVKQVEGLITEIARHLREQHGDQVVRVIATGGNSRMIAREIPCIEVVDELAVVHGSRLLLERNLRR